MKIRKLAALAVSAVLTLCGCAYELDESDIEGIIEKADEFIGNIAAQEASGTASAEKTTASPETTASGSEKISEAASSEAPASMTEETVDYSYEVTYTFRSSKYLHEHFEKHGAEFGYTTEQEYVDGANSVIVSADALHKTEAEDGDDIYYIEETNEFVVVSTDGYIRTYFKPSRGIAYYYAQ